MEDEPGPDRNLEPLKSACLGSREALNHVNTTLDDIADKGVWTARTAVIVLGIVVSAVSIGPPLSPSTPSDNLLLLAGFAICFLFLAILLGLGLYLRTENEEGIGDSARERVLRDTISRDDYWIGLLRGYREWIRVMDTRTDRAGTWLYTAWFCPCSGLLLLTVAAVLSIDGA